MDVSSKRIVDPRVEESIDILKYKFLRYSPQIL